MSVEKLDQEKSLTRNEKLLETKHKVIIIKGSNKRCHEHIFPSMGVAKMDQEKSLTRDEK